MTQTPTKPTKQIYFENLCFIVPLKLLRNTPNVQFFSLPGMVEGLADIDLVKHAVGAKSPTISGDATPYWYMHTDQEDNLLVYDGVRIVDLYSKAHGKVEQFEVSANWIKHQGKVIYEGAAIFGWPPYVFHRVHSPNGSLSTNYAKRTPQFSIETNFNIYTLNTETGDYQMKRLGKLDQPE